MDTLTEPAIPKAARSASVFIPEIALLMVERMDLQSLSAFSRTCSANNRLINAYQHSIVKAKMQMLPNRSLLPSSGAILSSFNQEREVLEPYSFESFQEIYMRDRRIDAMFSDAGMLLYAIQEDDAFALLPPEEMANLVEALKRAVRVTDRLADCLADVMMKNRQSQDASRPEAHHETRQSHREQISFILHSLSVRELSFLYTLSDLAGIAYARVHPFGEGDPDPWPRIFAFKEALLRHGSIVLWSWLKPSGFNGNGEEAAKTSSSKAVYGLARYAEGIVDNLMTEIEMWEEGRGASKESEFDDESLILPGLRAKIAGEVARATGRPKERAVKEMEFQVLWTVREQTGGLHG